MTKGRLRAAFFLSGARPAGGNLTVHTRTTIWHLPIQHQSYAPSHATARGCNLFVSVPLAVPGQNACLITQNREAGPIGQ